MSALESERNGQASSSMDEEMKNFEAAKVNENLVESLASRVTKVEEALADILLDVQVENIGHIVVEEEEGNVKFQDSKGEKGILGNDSTREGRNGAGDSRAHSTRNSTGSGSSKKGLEQDKFECLEENKKLKGEVTELRRQLSSCLHTNEKLKVELNEKINELENKNSEKERLVVEVYQEVFKCMDENEKLQGELAELKRQCSSSAAEKEQLLGRYNALAEDHKKLDGKLIKALSQAIEQARAEVHDQTFPNTAEANADLPVATDETVLDLKLQKAVEVNKKRFEEFTTRILTRNGSKGLRGSGSRNLVQSSCTKKDCVNTTETYSPGARSGCEARNNGTTDHVNGSKGIQGSGHSNKKLPRHSPTAARNITEICVSDDETTPGAAAYNSDKHANVGEKKMILRKKCSKRNKRKRRMVAEESKADEDNVGDDYDDYDNKKKKKRVLVSPSCKVPDCNSDITDAEALYRRNNVCDFHAKATVVLLAGLKQRYCYYCHRFHELSEFDKAERTCCRRVAERRRKRK